MTFRGPSEVGQPVEKDRAACSDMHSEPYDVHVGGDAVVAEPDRSVSARAGD